jgi:2,5-diketo-D-gluconate reductase A
MCQHTRGTVPRTRLLLALEATPLAVVSARVVSATGERGVTMIDPCESFLGKLTLNNGVQIPQLGYGVFQVPEPDAQRLTEIALASGYRHIDTASAYNNEEGVGRAVAASGLARDDVFVTTKLWNSDQGYESALAAFETSRTKLGLDYIDLYLIHFPAPQLLAYQDSWRALEKLYEDGVVRAIGVSNFKAPYLDRLLSFAEVVPAVHQIEVHPTYQQAELDALSRRHEIVVEAYSPLGRGADLTHPVVLEIAERLDLSVARVILRWHLQRCRVPLPKSDKSGRIAENIALDFELSSADLDAIDALEAGQRTGEDVETFN